MENKNRLYNKTKKWTLEILEEYGIWIEVPIFARKAGIRPVRRAYTYIARLQRLGLVERKKDRGKKIQFQITDKGRERLNWLRRQEPPRLEEYVVPLMREVGFLKTQ